MNGIEIISKRLKELRESVGLSQNKLGKIAGIPQSSINRYENGTATPSPKNMIWLADFYDVSLDYIYGRCDSPHGRKYEYKPKHNVQVEKILAECFNPKSRANQRLKEHLWELVSLEIEVSDE